MTAEDYREFEHFLGRRLDYLKGAMGWDGFGFDDGKDILMSWLLCDIIKGITNLTTRLDAIESRLDAAIAHKSVIDNEQIKQYILDRL